MGFGALFAVLLLFAAYFYLFSSGIELQGGVTSYTGGKASVQVTVQNNGLHELRDLTIGEKKGLAYKQLAVIGTLKPKEKRLLSIELESEGKSEAVLSVRGAFQDEVTATVPLLKQALPLSITLSGPNTVFVNSKFKMELELCNPTGLEVGNAKVSAVPKDASVAAALNAEQETAIPKNSCSKTVFEFSALSAGKTAIIFNINALNDTKTAQKEITVTK